ncbi:tRNA-intron lyase [Halorussus gelatinilyticus]|uniref:tRNA-splicing endonuclease n=1 Tax=Halorussus gelatinilyticus TaxID=2937524 RepID=A0A8U0IM33_9EURY|nr:tRNA-intron lyase [Halorussus gelatinilyticus]UPW01818.1 tRNA-intron lyase [Halorussus gelatinilyticus]
MDGRLRDDEVVVGGDARQRYYDSSGYGRPLEANSVALSRVEAAYLLFKGDLDGVDGMGFREFLADAGDEIATRFLVYADLRDRGFYLSPAREGWVDAPRSNADFVVYPRGKGPWDDSVLYRVRVVGERADVPADRLGDVVLAVVDEESEITYLETDRADLRGSSATDLPAGVPADLLDDRVLVWDPPEELHHRGFYGQPLDDRDRDRDRALQLSLVEAAYLADEGVLSLGGRTDDPETETVREHGREVEGERFDRRLRVYRALRERGMVPKTGFKFGSDFRTYADVESVEELGHSECLVRVLPTDHIFSPRDLALDVRLAHGVRKRMIFALVGPNEEITDWISVGRLTP